MSPAQRTDGRRWIGAFPARRTRRGAAGGNRAQAWAVRVFGVPALALLGALSVPVAASAALPRPQAPAGATCQNPAEPGGQLTDVPWAQRLFDPQRLAPLSTGVGITVAVLDSGVDSGHPQLTGRVNAGFDFLRNAPGGDFDCTSHGTAVASLIAAQPVAGIGLRGLAPGVKILPVRVSEHEDNSNGGSGEAVTPDTFAKAIRWAADNGAKIINVSLTLDHDYPVVAQAVDYAVKTKGCLVVAAAGNHHSTAADSAPAPSVGAPASPVADPPSYPADYPDVLGVGAVNEDGTRLPQSQIGRYVDVVAPGGAVLAATRIRGYATWSGTSFAAPLVSAAAALVWAAAPQLKNTDVAWRLSVTADPMPAGRPGEFGHGLVDPYRALTEQLTARATGAPAVLPERSLDPAAAARGAAWHTDGRVAAVAGLSILALVVSAWLLAVAVRRARLRQWRPAPPPEHTRPEHIDEPEEVFFSLPRRPSR